MADGHRCHRTRDQRWFALLVARCQWPKLACHSDRGLVFPFRALRRPGDGKLSGAAKVFRCATLANSSSVCWFEALEGANVTIPTLSRNRAKRQGLWLSLSTVGRLTAVDSQWRLRVFRLW